MTTIHANTQVGSPGEQMLHAEQLEVDVELPTEDKISPEVLASLHVLDHGPARRVNDSEGTIAYGRLNIGESLEDWLGRYFPGIKRIDVQFLLSRPVVDENVIMGLKRVVAALVPMINRCEFYIDVGFTQQIMSPDQESMQWQTGETYRIIKAMFVSEGTRKWREFGWPGSGEAKVKQDDANLWGWGRSAEIISWIDT